MWNLKFNKKNFDNNKYIYYKISYVFLHPRNLFHDDSFWLQRYLALYENCSAFTWNVYLVHLLVIVIILTIGGQ